MKRCEKAKIIETMPDEYKNSNKDNDSGKDLSKNLDQIQINSSAPNDNNQPFVWDKKVETFDQGNGNTVIITHQGRRITIPEGSFKDKNGIWRAPNGQLLPGQRLNPSGLSKVAKDFRELMSDILKMEDVQNAIVTRLNDPRLSDAMFEKLLSFVYTVAEGRPGLRKGDEPEVSITYNTINIRESVNDKIDQFFGGETIDAIEEKSNKVH